MRFPLRQVWLTLLIPLASGFAPALGQVVSYEGLVFPENDPAPWTRIMQGSPALRWLDNGVFYQSISPGQFDGYKRSIGEFTASASFYVAWREVSDAPSSELSGVPNGMSVWSSTTADTFHFTVTRDQVQFLRDNPLALELYVDIQPGVFHTYYLALQGGLSYFWYIDGTVANSGHYPSGFPDISGQILWAARCNANDQVQSAKWDYIRYGVIPADHSGDFDSNGVVNANDLYFFIDCLLGPDYDASGPGCRWADMNGDGKADGADIQLFSRAMVGQ